MELWEILVPTLMGDNLSPVKTTYHKEWDKFVRNISGGLTVLKPAKGQWISESNQLFEERVIPVRIACNESQILEIIDFTMEHYKQIAIMAYRISDKVLIVEAKNAKSTSNESTSGCVD